MWALILWLATGPAFAAAQAGIETRIAAHPALPELAPGQDPPEEVSFAASGMVLKGFLYQPKGTPPFPAVLWNHGSEKLPGWQPELAAFYNARGFVFFVPHRRGQGRSPGPYIVDVIDRYRKTHLPGRGVDAETVRQHELYSEDVTAAIEWLKAQPYVDAKRIVVSGVSFGGIQTLLAAEKGLGVRGFVAFAPGAMSWSNGLLRERLALAVKNAKAPVFLLQAANDYSTGPSEMLGPEILKKGAPNQARLYPAFGTTRQQGHGAFACWNLGTEVWGADVEAFIRAITAP